MNYDLTSNFEQLKTDVANTSCLISPFNFATVFLISSRESGASQMGGLAFTIRTHQFGVARLALPAGRGEKAQLPIGILQQNQIRVMTGASTAAPSVFLFPPEGSF